MTNCETLYFLKMDLIFGQLICNARLSKSNKKPSWPNQFIKQKSVFCQLCKLQRWGHANIHIQLNYYNYYSKLCILPMLHHHYIAQCSDKLHFTALYCVDTLDDLTENHISVTVKVTAIFLQQEKLMTSN